MNKCFVCGKPLDATRIAHGAFLCADSACVRAWRLKIPREAAEQQLEQDKPKETDDETHNHTRAHTFNLNYCFS